MDVEPGGNLDCASGCGAVHIQGLKFGQLTEVKFYQVEVLSKKKDPQRQVAEICGRV